LETRDVDLESEAKELSKWIRTERAVIFYFGYLIGSRPDLRKNFRLHFRKSNVSPDAVLIAEGPRLKGITNIEFEVLSSNAKPHFEKNKEIPYLIVVCWKHDWKDCPVPVLELESEKFYEPKK